MPRYVLAFSLLLFVPACANSCAGGEETTQQPPQEPQGQQQQGASVEREGGRGGSRFAKPFVPGQPPVAPEGRDE